MAGDADRDVELWRQLASAQRRVIRDLDRNLRETLGYPAIWIDTLIALAGAPAGRQQMKVLGVQLGSTPSGLAGLADRMTSAGLVQRERHPTDGRAAVLVLMPLGRQELRRTLPRYHEAIQRTALGSLTAAERHALQRALRTLGS